MSRKQIVILALTGGFIILVVLFGFFSKDGGRSPLVPFSGPDAEVTPGEENGVMDGERVFAPEVPEDAVPTVPQHESPAAPNTEVKLGFFDMSVSASGYEPSSLTVKLGNLVQIKLTGVGGAYDFSMPWTGLYQKVNDGETKQISFQTTSVGTFLFECRDFCPVGKKIQGELIVTP